MDKPTEQCAGKDSSTLSSDTDTNSDVLRQGKAVMTRKKGYIVSMAVIITLPFDG